MSPDFTALVRDCADEAERLGMLTWLYDEDRWPSGFAGGLVTSDPAFRCRALRLTRRPCAPGEARPHPVHHSPDLPQTERRFAAAWALRFDGAGRLATARRMPEDGRPGAGEVGLWGYVEPCPTSTWFNGEAYVDILNPKAIQRFIEVTHDRYTAALGDRLGRTVPAIFTDEPLFRCMDPPAPADTAREHFFAWTDDLPATYRAAWGEELFDVMPGVLHDRADGGSARDRWRFHDHHSERFASAFADQLGAWCAAHGIALTGHLMAEESLASQTAWVGDAMRSYRSFQIPGIDLLCDNLEFSTAKQAQSAARQYGRPGCLSELYGVTNWDFDFQGHKRQGDWQAALGIIVRVHHLAWYGMAGEAKRDYPASIAWQSPWWPAYPVVEDHFARLNTVLTRGAPHCRLAVVHPIEGFWALSGARPEDADEATTQEQTFQDSIRWLLHGLIDFDFLCESLLPTQGRPEAAPRLRVGAMAYDAVLLPRLRHIRSSTLDRLEAFADAGGSLIFAGGIPCLVDGEPSDRAERLAARCRRIALDRPALLAALAPWRDLDVLHGPDDAWRAGRRPDGLLHQMRAEDGVRWIFVCNSDREQGHDGLVLRLRGAWSMESLDTADGSLAAQPCGQRDGWTEVACDLPAAGHLLLRATPAAAAEVPLPARPAQTPIRSNVLDDPLPFTLEEPNVLLLDRAAWRLDEGPWQPETEVLRAANLARAAAGLPPLTGEVAQPWARPPAPSRHRAGLAFSIRCEVAVSAPRLALERAAQARIRLDGQVAPVSDCGHWVDEDIRLVALPDLAPGVHRLEVDLPIDAWDGLEPCYLLGRFGVAVVGRHARLTALPETLAFGDQVHQGLPFYTGNLVLHARLDGNGQRARLWTPRFAAPLLGVALDGVARGPIAFAPYRLDLGTLAPGAHRLDLTVYGNRMNCFGQVHNPNPRFRWWGPGSYRTGGRDWSDAYVLRPHGILAAPVVEESA
jgi:hypothetical protein